MIRTIVIAAALVAASAAAAQSLYGNHGNGIWIPFYTPPVNPLPPSANFSQERWGQYGGPLYVQPQQMPTVTCQFCVPNPNGSR